MDLAAIRKGVLKGFAWQGLTKLIVQIASWCATLFVARLIEPSDYGLVAAAAVITELLVVVTDLGLSQGLVQRAVVTPRELDGVFYVSFLIGLLAYLGLFVLAPRLARFYEMPILTDIIRLSGLGVVLGAMRTVPLAIAMRNMDFRYRSLVEMGGSLTMTLTVIGLALLDFGVWSLVWGPVVAHFVMMCAYLPLLGRVPRPRFTWQEVYGPIRYGLQVTGTNLLYYGWSRADVVIIGKMLGERLLGIYSIAFQLAVLPLDKVGAIFSQVLFPALARLQSDLKASQEMFLQQHRNLLLITYPVLLGMVAVAEDAVPVLLTEKWSPIVPFLQGLCLVSAVRISGMLMPVSLHARGKPGLVLVYGFLALLLLPATFLLGVRYGLEGIVVGWMVAYPVLYFVLGTFALRDLKLTWWQLYRPVLPVLSAAVLMMASVMWLRATLEDASPLARLAAAVGVGGLIYSSLILFLFRHWAVRVWGRFVLRRGEAP